MLAAPRVASSTGGGPPAAGPAPRRAGAGPAPLPVMTVLAYGADMGPTLREQSVSSQKGFGADLLEALIAAAELINTGRSAGGEELRTAADVAAFGRRYGMGGRARETDMAAVRMINALLAETGAIPQIVAHDGRGPHIHVSRAAAPMSDRIAAHLAMGLAELLVAGESGRLRTCASPACSEVFLDESRNRSRRYCDSRTCGNRLHVAAYRARKAHLVTESRDAPSPAGVRGVAPP